LFLLLVWLLVLALEEQCDCTSSRFAFKPVPESLRTTEVKFLKTKLAEKDFGQGYVVVTGGKGVGKTCLLKTVTSKTPGVI
jgi:Cdc6-like AAA superfamily ATPase